MIRVWSASTLHCVEEYKVTKPKSAVVDLEFDANKVNKNQHLALQKKIRRQILRPVGALCKCYFCNSDGEVVWGRLWQQQGRKCGYGIEIEEDAWLIKWVAMVVVSTA